MIWEKRNFQQTDKRPLTLAVFLDSLCVLVSSLILELVGPSSILDAFKGHSLDWFLDIIPIPRPCCQWANWLSYCQLGRFPVFVCDVVYHYPWKCYYREVLHE